MTSLHEVNRRTIPRERSLDSDDWIAMRALGHRMVDDMLGHLQHMREQPTWQAVPGQVRRYSHTWRGITVEVVAEVIAP